WPMIKKKITSYTMTFERLKELPPPQVGSDGFDAALDDAFAEKKKDEHKGDFQSISEIERKLHGLVSPNRDVRKLIDLGCVGEFETCKSLLNLVNLEYLRPIIGSTSKDDEQIAASSLVEKAGGALGRILVTMLVLAGLE